MSVENVITEPIRKFLLVTLVAAWSLSMCVHPLYGEEDPGERKVTVRVVAVLSTDDLGAELRYPSSVYCDLAMDETYVVGGGEGKVVVYGPNFFPVASLAGGRGADAPRGIYIDGKNNLYVCQGKSASRPGRVTMYNSAFFPEQEITFADMPEGENFAPGNLVIGRTGNMYITGLNTRGVMVLDGNGGFLHWLKPRDRIVDRKAIEALGGLEAVDPETRPPDSMGSEQGEATEEENALKKLLPPALQPRGRETDGSEEPSVIGPVKIVDVKRDSTGHLYLLSEETSKVYVYSSAEEFLFSFGRKGGSTGKMSRPKSLVIDEKRKAVFIVDYMRHTILIYDLGGRFMYEFGGLGRGPGWFQYPSGLAMNREGQLLVADLFNHRVQVLDVQFDYTFPMFMAPDEQEPPYGGQLPDEGRDEELIPEEGEILQPQPL